MTHIRCHMSTCELWWIFIQSPWPPKIRKPKKHSASWSKHVSKTFRRCLGIPHSSLNIDQYNNIIFQFLFNIDHGQNTHPCNHEYHWIMASSCPWPPHPLRFLPTLAVTKLSALDWNFGNSRFRLGQVWPKRLDPKDESWWKTWKSASATTTTMI